MTTWGDIYHRHLRAGEDNGEAAFAADQWEKRMEKKRAKDPRDAAVVELLMGLTTDGVHHKQFYLEQAFRALCEDGYVEKAKAKFQWQDGVPA